MSFNFLRVIVSVVAMCLIISAGSHAQSVTVTADGGVQISGIGGVCNPVSAAAAEADPTLVLSLIHI